jgi:hypothetical protein
MRIRMRIRILVFSSLTFPRCQQKANFKKKFFCLLLFEGTFTSFSKIKKSKRSRNRNQGYFFYFFCLIIEGSRSGSVPMTDGSGSGSRRPKNIWIRIRIRNTAFHCAAGMTAIKMKNHKNTNPPPCADQVSEVRRVEDGSRHTQVLLRATPDRMISQLVEAGLQKTQVFFYPAQCFFLVFWVFCPEERVLGFFSVSRTLLGASRL